MEVSKILRPRVSLKVMLLATAVYLVLASILVIVVANPPDSTAQSYCRPTNTWEAPSTFPERDVAPIFDRTLPRINLPVPPYEIFE